MASDSDWVQDVRRWYFGGNPPSSEQVSAADSISEVNSDVMVGYEAAHPALQARHWPDAPSMDVTLQS
jgi:hypothetical protein